eukprot:9208446-Pyramimonas_sp.AAC.1
MPIMLQPPLILNELSWSVLGDVMGRLLQSFFERSWAVLGASSGCLGPVLAVWRLMGLSWGHVRLSWSPRGVVLSRLEGLFGPSLGSCNTW